MVLTETLPGYGLRLLSLVLLLAGCMGTFTTDAGAAEAINEIGHELGMLRDENAQLQFQVDPLRGALARQDSVLRQLANLSGVPLTR